MAVSRSNAPTSMKVGTHDDLVTALGLATLDESVVTPGIALARRSTG
jgi:hypothetical protein